MTVCHMIRLLSDTNGISVNERPAVWPLLIPHIPVLSPLPLFLFTVSISSPFPKTVPSLSSLCFYPFN